MGKTITLNLKKLLYIVLLIAIAFVAGVIGSKLLFNGGNANPGEIKRALKRADDLTTLTITENGSQKFNDSGIIVVNKGDFTVSYKAKIGVGVDLKKVDINVNNINKKIYVTMPKPKVFYVSIDADSLSLSDKKFAVFNFNEKEDMIKMTGQIKKRLENSVDSEEYIEAGDSAEDLVRGIITKAAPRYEVVFK